MVNPDYFHIKHLLKTGAPSEDIWMDAQAHGAWISFNAFGDVEVCMDSRSPYCLIFTLRYSDWISQTTSEGYFV